MNYYDTLLQQCCAEEDIGRYCLTNPHSDGQKVCATDGHIMAIVPLAACENSYQAQKHFPTLPAFVTLDRLRPYVLPTLSETLAEELRAAAETQECSRCEGTGQCVCECGDEQECGECEGSGDICPVVRVSFMGTDGSGSISKLSLTLFTTSGKATPIVRFSRSIVVQSGMCAPAKRTWRSCRSQEMPARCCNYPI